MKTTKTKKTTTDSAITTTEETTTTESIKNEFYHQKKNILSWKIHQFWINFIGSIIGWMALAYIIFVRCCKFDTIDIAIFIIAIVGITGFLPYTISKMTNLK